MIKQKMANCKGVHIFCGENKNTDIPAHLYRRKQREDEPKDNETASCKRSGGETERKDVEGKGLLSVHLKG